MSRLNIGDVITIDGVYADGTTGLVASEKPLQQWKCAEVEGDDYRLIPLHEDGTVDTFNASCGEFWIKGKK